MAKKKNGAKQDTMKCIRIHDTQEISRVRYEEADELVHAGKASFVPKKEWKANKPVDVLEEVIEVKE